MEIEARREVPPDDADRAACGLVVLQPFGRFEQGAAVAGFVDPGSASHQRRLEEIVFHLVPAPVPAEDGAVGRGGVHGRAGAVGRRLEIEVAVADVCRGDGERVPALLGDLGLEARLRAPARHERIPSQHRVDQLGVELALDQELAHRHGLPPLRRTIASSGMTSAR
jgi:hypothetical protein